MASDRTSVSLRTVAAALGCQITVRMHAGEPCFRLWYKGRFESYRTLTPLKARLKQIAAEQEPAPAKPAKPLTCRNGHTFTAPEIPLPEGWEGATVAHATYRCPTCGVRVGASAK
jgi:hypothetical protein